MPAKKAAPKAAAPKAEAPKSPAPRKPAPNGQSTPVTPNFNGNARADISPDELRKLIAEAAYYRAKQRGFEPGHELEDWVEAEAEVIRRLNG